MAENYRAGSSLEPGEVVCLAPERDSVVRSTKPDDQLVCGVVSTKPGLLLNAGYTTEEPEPLVPVALCGRVPCKVVTETGPIRRGDLLTSSSTPGHAMRAVPVRVEGHDVYRAGTIVGKALDSVEEGAAVIEMFVSPA
jgi:hypothetical protein